MRSPLSFTRVGILDPESFLERETARSNAFVVDIGGGGGLLDRFLRDEVAIAGRGGDGVSFWLVVVELGGSMPGFGMFEG